MSLILNEFRKMREKKVPERELTRSKEYMKGSMLLSLESTTNRMFRLAQSEIYYNRLKTIEESIADIDAITADQIMEMANELLDESTLSKIILKSGNSQIKKAA